MEKQFVVGGAVRDVLLGREPKDLDFVWVGQTPEKMIELGYDQVGADFPVFLDEDGNEHALARKERKVAAGYNGFETDFDPSVSLEDDLIRRDLTINAMAVPFESWSDFVNGYHSLVVDPFNGRIDLKHKILRHVSDAFAEDPVRVLRVARFAARYGFNISLETISLMTQLVKQGELDSLVPERVWAETEKALNEYHVMAFFRTLEMCQASDVLFPELSLNGFLESSLRNTTELDNHAIFALICLQMDEVSINGMCDRLKIPNEYRKFAIRSTEFVNTLRQELTPESVVGVLESIGAFQDPSNLNDVRMVALHSAYNTPKYHERLTRVVDISSDVLPLRFADLSDDQRDTLKGSEIGAALRTLRQERVFSLL